MQCHTCFLHAPPTHDTPILQCMHAMQAIWGPDHTYMCQGQSLDTTTRELLAALRTPSYATNMVPA